MKILFHFQDFGTLTCGGYPGSIFHMEKDSQVCFLFLFTVQFMYVFFNLCIFFKNPHNKLLKNYYICHQLISFLKCLKQSTFQVINFQTFADWGIDMLKVDGCYSCNSLMPKGYETFGFWLNKTERPILYSCSWPAYIPKDKPYKDIARLCNIWRNYADIQVRKVFAFYSGKNMY